MHNPREQEEAVECHKRSREPLSLPDVEKVNYLKQFTRISRQQKVPL